MAQLPDLQPAAFDAIEGRHQPGRGLVLERHQLEGNPGGAHRGGDQYWVYALARNQRDGSPGVESLGQKGGREGHRRSMMNRPAD